MKSLEAGTQMIIEAVNQALNGRPQVSFCWAVVTQLSPLRVIREGEDVALEITPDTLVNVSVGDRVRLELSLTAGTARRAVIHGRSEGPVPTGVTLEFSGSVAPAGFLMEDGASYLRTDYPRLFATIGTAFGSVDGTHFNVPSHKGKTAVGQDTGQTEFDVLGETGGAKSVTLTAAESGLPSHNHTQDAHNHFQDSHAHSIYDPGHAHSARQPYRLGGDASASGEGITGSNVPTYPTPAYYNGMPGFTTGAAGTGIGIYGTTPTNQGSTATNQANTAANATSAHSNLQPYIVKNFIIKT